MSDRTSLSQFGLRYNPGRGGIGKGHPEFMMRRLADVLRTIASVGTLPALVAASSAAVAVLLAGPAAADEPVRVQIVFDGSGSMWGKMPGSSDAKLTIAREALRQAVPALDRSTEIGLVLFGHRRRGDCSDVEQAVGLGPVDPQKLLAPLEPLNPKGRGPLTLAMVAAADVLPGGEGRESLVLIHDDYDNCQNDPCQMAGELHRARPGLAIHVVSIGTKPEDAERIACVPRITGGKHFHVTTADAVAPAVAEALRLASLDTGGLQVPKPKAISRDELGPPGLRLTAALAEGGEAIDEPVTWRVYSAGGDGKASKAPIVETTEIAPRLSLPPGDYEIEASRDLVTVKQSVKVAANRPTPVTVALDAGVIQLSAAPFSEAGGEVSSDAVITLMKQGDDEAEGEVVWLGPASERELFVPAGSYRIVLQDGQFRAERSIVVPSGSRGAPPLATAVGRIRVEARDFIGLETPADEVLFRILEDDPAAPDGRREVARSAASRAEFKLPAGTYHLVARKGAAEIRELIPLGAGDDVRRIVDLKLARISLSAQLPGETPPAIEKATWRVFQLDGNADGPVARSIRSDPTLQLPAGRYRVEVRVGRLNAVASREVELSEASEQSLVLQPSAGRLELRLSYGGLPLSGGDVFWDVRDSSGQVVWRTMEPEPRDFLAAGVYTVRAETRERRLEQTVELHPGEVRQLDMALE